MCFVAQKYLFSFGQSKRPCWDRIKSGSRKIHIILSYLEPDPDHHEFIKQIRMKLNWICYKKNWRPLSGFALLQIKIIRMDPHENALNKGTIHTFIRYIQLYILYSLVSSFTELLQDRAHRLSNFQCFMSKNNSYTFCKKCSDGHWYREAKMEARKPIAQNLKK